VFVVEIRGPGDELRHVQIDGAEATLGRLADNDLQLPRGNVSKRHARIVQRHAKIFVIDLQSTNGTYVNGERTAQAKLKPGDRLGVGRVELRVELADS